MKRLTLIILMLTPALLLAQEKERTIDFKFYGNINLYQKYTYHDYVWSNNQSHVEYKREVSGFNFSPAITINKANGNGHEFELSRLGFSNNYDKSYLQSDSTGLITNVIGEYSTKSFDLTLRYEYQVGLFKKKDWEKLKLTLGFSLAPFISTSNFTPMTSTSFTTSVTSYGLATSLIPRIKYALNEKWYLDFNIPFNINNLYVNTVNNQNPAIPVDQRKETTINAYSGPINASIRIGIGVNLK